MVDKVTAILNSRQIYGRSKQYKCLIYNYSPYEFEWINGVNLPNAQTLIKDFEARKIAKAQAAADTRVNKPPRKQSTTSKKLPLLIYDNDIKVENGQATWHGEEPNGQ